MSSNERPEGVGTAGPCWYTQTHTRNTHTHRHQHTHTHTRMTEIDIGRFSSLKNNIEMSDQIQTKFYLNLHYI